ncbi:MAG: polysaccharide deacetylase family protein [Chitinophagaceae bacterium]|nr:polysaccharide deacetylase family protein [Chitinophagaceae bacterium]
MTLKHLRIYTEQITPRFEYACHIIFKVLWQIPYSIHEQNEESQTSDTLTIFYNCPTPENGFLISSCGLVFSNDIQPLEIDVLWKNEVPIIFGAEKKCSLGFDIFSAVFFMASRYEEYLPFVPDRFGRFPEVESLSGKNDFTHLPVVHLWVELLGKKLKKHFPGFEIVKRPPKAVFTYDIDVAYAFKGRSLGLHLLSLGKDVLRARWENLKLKLKTGFGIFDDPSDTYKLLIENDLDKIYFFLLSKKRTSFDRNLSPDNPKLKQLIVELCKGNIWAGIHPSYYSSDNNELIFNEKETLEEIINQPVSMSRQHFLRFRLPDTYRALENAGIQHDYSMQYPEMPGFRAGICLPYPFFDLQANQMTNLILHPGCIMDTTFRDDLFLPANQSMEWYLSLWESVKKVGGRFITIWHNDTLQDHRSEKHPLAFRTIHQNLLEIVRKDLETTE